MQTKTKGHSHQWFWQTGWPHKDTQLHPQSWPACPPAGKAIPACSEPESWWKGFLQLFPFSTRQFSMNSYNPTASFINKKHDCARPCVYLFVLLLPWRLLSRRLSLPSAAASGASSEGPVLPFHLHRSLRSLRVSRFLPGLFLRSQFGDIIFIGVKIVVGSPGGLVKRKVSPVMLLIIVCCSKHRQTDRSIPVALRENSKRLSWPWVLCVCPVPQPGRR